MGTRRLSAIVFTDIQGFTSATQRDEKGALHLVDELERISAPIIADHAGRRIKSIGDGMLIEFPNALDALNGAVSLQLGIRERNRAEPSRAINLRIGIHLGDVEVRGDDILGDAVNIASRIEPLAEPGTICLSAQVYDQVRNKVTLGFVPMGPRPRDIERGWVEV